MTSFNPLNQTLRCSLFLSVFCSLFISSLTTSFAANLANESIAGIHLGENATLLLRRLGRPQKKSKVLFDHMDNCEVQILFYEKIGVEIGICRRNGVSHVRSLRMSEVSGARTTYQRKVGDREAQIHSAYPEAVSLGGGVWSLEDLRRGISMLFFIEDGVISEISLIRHPAAAQQNSRITRRLAYR